MKLRRYLRLLGVFARASISAQMEYRANFLVSLFGALLAAGGALFGLLVLSGDGQPVGGWSYREACIVVGLFTIIQGFIGTLLYPNLNKIGESIRLGTMDFTLLKPIDSQFLVSTRNVNFFTSFAMLIGAGITIWAASGIPGLTPAQALAGALLFGAALAIVYAIWFILTTTAFWFVKVENITELFNGLFRAGQFPVTAFPGWVRLLFTFVVPVAFITTVPAEAILGRINLGTALAALGIALGLLLVARWFWGVAVRSYTSASS
jgi:viologen exporter family transport system permease protein